MKRKVLVLGAGIQGCCIALELANRGFKVDLIEQDSVPFNRSSIRNEGKIHLGLVYINDTGFETPKLMLKAALRFAPYLSRWIGIGVKDLNIGTPFYYLVSNQSFLDTEQLEQRYHQLEKLYCESTEKESFTYLGYKPDKLVQKSSEENLAKHFNTDCLQGGFYTSELAIDTSKLAEHIRKAVKKHSNITFLGNHRILGISKNGSGYIVEGEKNRSNWKKKSLQVVNATWTDKFKLDETLGISPPKEILHRLKYRVIADIPEEMKNFPSATMVIGKFGDVVIRPDKTAYLSWYPDACRGWSNSIEPPESWNEPSRGIVPKKDFDEISEKLIRETEKWYPAIRNCTPKIVDAGIIVAHGKTDVDNKKSRLHERSNIGVTSYDGYHSVETGKLTTAPMFAMDTADRAEKIYRQL